MTTLQIQSEGFVAVTKVMRAVFRRFVVIAALVAAPSSGCGGLESEEAGDTSDETVTVVSPLLSPSQRPVAYFHTDGRVIVFARDTSNRVIYNQQNFVNGNGGWSGWKSLGGTATEIAVSDTNGYIQVFVRGSDNAIHLKGQLVQSSDQWSGWIKLGGTAAGAPAATRDFRNRVWVFVKGTDGALWANRRDPESGNWSGFSTLSAPLGTSVQNDPAVANEPYTGVGTPAVYVFVKGTSGHLFAKKYTTSWSGWTDLLGGITSARVAVGVNKNNRLQVFTRGTDGGMYSQTQSAHMGDWPKTWNAIGLPGSVVVGMDPAIGRAKDGALQLFVVRDDRVIYRRAQQAPSSGSWGPWGSMGGAATSPPTSQRNTNGVSEVFVVGTDHRLYHSQQQQAGNNNSWTGWGSVTPEAILK